MRLSNEDQALGPGATTRTTAAAYEEIYARSVNDPDGFWRDEARRLDWIKAT